MTDLTKLREAAETYTEGQYPGHFSDAIIKLIDRVERAEEALRWYAQQVGDCRKITPEGDIARRALDKDGGSIARAALSHKESDATQPEVKG